MPSASAQHCFKFHNFQGLGAQVWAVLGFGAGVTEYYLLSWDAQRHTACLPLHLEAMGQGGTSAFLNSFYVVV